MVRLYLGTLRLVFINEAAKEGTDEDEGDAADKCDDCIVERGRNVVKESVLCPGHINILLDHHFLLRKPASPRLQSLKVEWDHRFLSNSLPATLQGKGFESFEISLALILATLCRALLALILAREEYECRIALDLHGAA